MKQVIKLKQASKKYLIDLAYNAIAERLGIGEKAGRGVKVGRGEKAGRGVKAVRRPDDPELDQSRALFVTLEIDGRLRGCVGTFSANPIERTVREYALNAAFNDFRFEPLTARELSRIDIEISLLGPFKVLEYDGVSDLIAKLADKPGVYISKNGCSATYLPQVWEQMPDAEVFLSELCSKAGLAYDEWKKGGLRVEIYEAEVF